jgi:hypothetical protein
VTDTVAAAAEVAAETMAEGAMAVTMIVSAGTEYNEAAAEVRIQEQSISKADLTVRMSGQVNCGVQMS